MNIKLREWGIKKIVEINQDINIDIQLSLKEVIELIPSQDLEKELKRREGNSVYSNKDILEDAEFKNRIEELKFEILNEAFQRFTLEELKRRLS